MAEPLSPRRFRVEASCPVPARRGSRPASLIERDLAGFERDGSYYLGAAFSRSPRRWKIVYEGDTSVGSLVDAVERELGDTARIIGCEYRTVDGLTIYDRHSAPAGRVSFKVTEVGP